MKTKIRIAIYSRKSKYSDKGDSTGNQIELVNEYIKIHFPSDKYDVEIVIFEDNGFSGGTIDRPKFKEFLVEENKKPFDILICYRLDRISRNIADFSNLMNTLTDLGTSFISIKEQFDTKTPMGRAMMYIASVFAQLEREVIAERIRDNMIELAKTGRWLGGTAPTGFYSERIKLVDVYEQNDDNTLEKKKKTACKLVKIGKESIKIRHLYEVFNELKSLSKLESYCVKNKIRSKNNIDYSVSTLREILTNPVYAPNDQEVLEYFESKGIHIFADGDRANFDGKYGLIGYGKNGGGKENKLEDWIIAVGLHEPTVEGTLFIRTQDLIEKNKEKRYRSECKNNHLFSGVLRCSKCGSYMRPKTCGKKTDRFYYTCELKERSRGTRCNSGNIAGHILDKMVIDKIKDMFLPNSVLYNELLNMPIRKDTTNINERKETLQKRLNKNTEAIKNIVNKLTYIEEDVIDLVNSELKRLKSENEDIQKELDAIEIENQENDTNSKNSIESINVLDIINNCFSMFDYLDIKMRKDLVRMLIGEMKGDGKNVEIKLLNTKINDNSKRLFYSIDAKTAIKNNLKVVTRTGEQFH